MNLKIKKFIKILVAIHFGIVSVNATNNKVRVYHSVAKGGSIKSVQEHGLLNWQTLWNRGMTDLQPSKGLFPERAQVIYFDPTPSYEKYSDLAYLVDPEMTYVYNQHFRDCNNWNGYLNSRVLLKDFLVNYYKAEELKKQCPLGMVVILHYISSQPTLIPWENCTKKYFNNNLENYVKGRPIEYSGYAPEVIIHADRIPPDQLIFLKENR